jgi:CheY-like chemotaxis protein/anti-sigma regulatory factor (Ser/Thr protein kinase)
MTSPAGAKVLVVDDALVDRRLAGSVLGKDPAIHVDYANNGVEAIAKLEQQAPDLVITDLIMPEMDGFELVAAVRSRFPLVPVILMTSLGSEETAVKALQHGAASYVPKTAVPRDLLETVRQVLAVSTQRRGQVKLMECLTQSEASFELKNDRTLVGPLVGYLQETVTQLGLCDDAERTRIGVALEEALANALYHGNMEISSELREQDYNAYYALFEERTKLPPYRDRRVRVNARIRRDEAVFVVRDEGNGFDPSLLPDPTDPANLERLSGRGILLMRTFMDEVVYNAAGNEVTMTKRRAGS